MTRERAADLLSEVMVLDDPEMAEAHRVAISAIRQQETVINRNEPLTLEELRKMDGEPVWIVENPDWGHWELSADAEDYVTDREPSFYGMKHNNPAGRYGLHKLGWLAYRQKPEEDKHENLD